MLADLTQLYGRTSEGKSAPTDESLLRNKCCICLHELLSVSLSPLASSRKPSYFSCLLILCAWFWPVAAPSLVCRDDDDARDRFKNISDLRKILPEELEERDGIGVQSVPNTSEKGRQRGIDRSIGLSREKEKGIGRDDPTWCKPDDGSDRSSHSRIYNDAQKEILEAHFQVEKFIVKEIAQELASKIDRLHGGRAADWNCVNVWFMNRRKRDRICGGASCAESSTAGVVKNVVGEIVGKEGTGKGGRQKLRARYLMQQQEGSETGVSKESTDADDALEPRACSRKSTLKLPAEAIESKQEWLRDAEMGDDDDHGAHGVAGFMHKCWECRKGKYKGWKCSVRQCRSDVGSGVKGALGHTEPNWFDDEREKLLDESEKSAEMHSSKYAGSSSDKEQDSADEMSRPKMNGEECGISDVDGNGVAFRSARLCKQQSVKMQQVLAREQARADAAVAERDRLATSNNRLKASLQTAEQKVAHLLGHELGILTTTQLLNLQADIQDILGRVSGELLARECEADVIAKHPEFVCPLSEEGHGGANGGRASEVGRIGSRLMVDPVVAGDGHTYERANIEIWLNQKGNVRSPKTGERLSTKEVMPNRLAKAGITQALEDARKRKLEAQTAPASVAADVESLPLLCSAQALAPAGKLSAENTRGKAVRGVDANTRKREQDPQSKHGKVEESKGEKDAENNKHQSSDSLCPHCGRSFLNVPSAQR